MAADAATFWGKSGMPRVCGRTRGVKGRVRGDGDGGSGGPHLRSTVTETWPPPLELTGSSRAFFHDVGDLLVGRRRQDRGPGGIGHRRCDGARMKKKRP
jgi:hypothetical protein